MPEIQVRFRADGVGEDYDAGDITASLDGRPLAVEELRDFSAQTDRTFYIFLADASASISVTEENNQSAAMKQAIENFYKDYVTGADRIALISFGSRAEVLLDGSESSAEVEEAIRLLDNKAQETAFYDAINEALQLAGAARGNRSEREIAIMISDGVDDKKDGGGYRKDEIIRRLTSGKLPIYALGFQNGEKEELDDFGEIARESGGGIVSVSAKDIDEKLTQLGEYLKNCKVLTLKSGTNIVKNQTQTLRIEINAGENKVSAEISVEPADAEWIPDAEAPVVTDVAPRGGGRLGIAFSEPVSGAGIRENYIVTDSSGDRVPVQAVTYAESEDGAFAELILDGELYSGTYTVSFAGIYDVSMEQNALTGAPGFELSGHSSVYRYLQLIFGDYWWAVLAFVLILAAFILYVLVKRMLNKHKGLVKIDGKIGFGDAVEYRHRFETPETKTVRLVVTDIKGAANEVVLDINKSVFIGRSDINNLSFDDEKMSRQHFTIEIDGNDFYITDLETTNGTFLNGVQIFGKRRLSENDVITAGMEKFIFRPVGGR
jgi:Mg-chelatase subunit ChlD